jgi:hypothetical protein
MAHPGGEAKRHCARRIILFRLIKFPHKFAAGGRPPAARQNILCRQTLWQTRRRRFLRLIK